MFVEQVPFMESTKAVRTKELIHIRKRKAISPYLYTETYHTSENLESSRSSISSSYPKHLSITVLCKDFMTRRWNQFSFSIAILMHISLVLGNEAERKVKRQTNKSSATRSFIKCLHNTKLRMMANVLEQEFNCAN